MGDCSSNNCNPCGPDYNAINQLSTRAGAYARQANSYSVDAQNAWLEFNALYLGAFAVAPTVDNEGNPLQEGALYWNSASNELFAWSGITWILTTGFNEYTPFLGTGTISARNLVTRAIDFINVKDFGSVGNGIADDSPAFNEAAEFADTLKTATGKGPFVIVPTGKYYIPSPITTQATWFLMPGAEITDVSGGTDLIPPTQESDTRNLVGSIFRFDGIAQWNTITVGDPNYTLQKFTNKGFPSEVRGQSDNGAGGLTGTTFVKSGAAAAIGVTGCAVNDFDDSRKTCWGIYSEAYRTKVGCGNSFCAEFTTFNIADTIQTNPYQQPASQEGVVVGLWLSSGGTYGSPTITASNDATAAIGIIGKNGARYDRGIVIYEDSVRASKEGISMPHDYKTAWYFQYPGNPTLVAESRADLRQMFGYQVNPRTFTRRQNALPTGNTANNDLLYHLRVSGTVNGTDYDMAGIRFYQDSVIAANQAASRVTIDVNDSAGTSSSYNFDAGAFNPSVDNARLLGTASRRWSDVYAASGSVNSSDARLKVFLTIEDAEKAAALEIKQNMRKFKFTHAINKKGENARIHFGVSAQEIGSIMTKHGLDPHKYGFFCYDKWNAKEEILNENGEIAQEAETAGDIYGIRYEELLSFIIAAI